MTAASLRCGLPQVLHLSLRGLRGQLGASATTHGYAALSTQQSATAAATQWQQAAGVAVAAGRRRSQRRTSAGSSSGGGGGSSRRQLHSSVRVGATDSDAAAGIAGAVDAASQSRSGGQGLPEGGKRMILCDAMALLYRSHYAFSESHRLRNAIGEDTTVLFGFLSTLLNLLEVVPPPTHFAVVLDARGKTFRHEIYEGYKGQRQACPEEVKEAIPRLQQLLRAMAIPYVQVPGVEADDVIGTLAVRAVHEGIAVAVASPDKDFFQLLRPGIILLRPPKLPKPSPPKKGAPPSGAAASGSTAAAAAAAGAGGGAGAPARQKQGQGAAAAAGAARVSKYALVPYTAADFEEEYGLQPHQFVDVLALAGDASDNVPGVAGIGPKTAVALLKQYGSLGGVLEHAAEAKPKRAAQQLTSAEGRAAARLSQQLVRIETELDMPPVREPLDQLRLQLPADRGADLLRQFQALDFQRHSARVQALWASQLYQ